MRKEVIFAAASGGLLGLIIAYGIWRANSALQVTNQEPTKVLELQPKDANNPGSKEIYFSLVRPQNQQVITSSPVTIKAITRPNTIVAISSEDKDYLTSSLDNGSLETEISLVGGVNEIIFTAFPDSLEQLSEKLVLVYSSEFVKEVKEESPSSDIEKRVKEKLEEAKNLATSYIGTITDISQEAIQVDKFDFNGNSGEILQIGISEKTNFIKIDKTREVIKFSDVAIGDFLVAMGYKMENAVLDAQRILIINPLKKTSRKIIKAKVLEIKKGKILLEQSEGKNLSVNIPDNIVVKKFKEGSLIKAKPSEIVKDVRIIVVGQMNEDNELEARTVFLI